MVQSGLWGGMLSICIFKSFLLVSFFRIYVGHQCFESQIETEGWGCLHSVRMLSLNSPISSAIILPQLCFGSHYPNSSIISPENRLPTLCLGGQGATIWFCKVEEGVPGFQLLHKCLLVCLILGPLPTLFIPYSKSTWCWKFFRLMYIWLVLGLPHCWFKLPATLATSHPSAFQLLKSHCCCFLIFSVLWGFYYINKLLYCQSSEVWGGN